MTDSIEENVSRRNFMRNMGIAILAATTAGTGAAMVSREFQKSAATAAPIIGELPPVPTAVPAVQSAQTVVTAHNDAAELLQRLAESQAENLRLQAALEATQRDLDSLMLTNDSNRSATEDLSLRLSSANDRIGVLGGLVALYEQLDGVDVTDTIQGGMSAVADSITHLVEQTPTLDEGVQMGQRALAEIEDHLPTLEEGRIWLDAQANKLGAFYESVELVLQSALESVGSFLDMVNDWFDGVNKWLPFGIGTKAANVVNSLSELVAETPHTIAGLNTYVAQPLDHWLAREDGDTRLQKNLIKPVREQLLTEANETINRAQVVQTAYQEQLAVPIEATAATRELLRQQIANYRQQHEV
ncbi:MAG: hypothetical protein R3293_11950 [Candidatus Promineifilaceae bacterium]|nr:hypothetical protein [Candidatus Promineifilaceae bacterium]